MISIDICTTTYRNTEKLDRCIKTVLEKTKNVDYKWYIWCNDANDEVKKIVSNGDNRIIAVFNDNNNGSFSSNNNALSKIGNGEYILFLNDDVEPINEDWLFNMAKILETHEKVGVIGPLILYPDQKRIQQCGIIFLNNRQPALIYYGKLISKHLWFISQPRIYQAVTAACVLVRRKDFEIVNGFDENFYYGHEDIALCISIKSKLNKICIFCPDAKLIHSLGISYTNYKSNNADIFKLKYSKLCKTDYFYYLLNKNYMIFDENKF